jgi:hypothetical protein
MELPLVAPAPVVTEHAGVFRDLFDNQCQCRHVQRDLTGLMVLPNKSLANRARGILDSADKTNLSRLLSEAPWREAEVNRRRVQFMLQQTKPHRRHDSLVVIDDTLCEYVGDLFDHVDRPDNHGNGTYPLAHTPVTSFFVSVPVRFPLGLCLYRRYEELTQWEAGVAKHVPELKLPTDNKARNRWHQQVDPVWLRDPEFRARHEQFRTQMAMAIELLEEAIRPKVPFGVVGFDAWYLAEELVQVLARRRKDWLSLLKKTVCWKSPVFTYGMPMAGRCSCPAPTSGYGSSTISLTAPNHNCRVIYLGKLLRETSFTHKIPSEGDFMLVNGH